MVEVFVTGIGATTPLGGTAGDTWAGMLAGHSGVGQIEADWARDLNVRIAARLAVEPSVVLDTVQIRRLDRCGQVALIAAQEAWLDSGTPEVAPERLAVVVGTGIGGAHTMLDQDQLRRERGARQISPFTVPMLMPNGPAAAVAMFVGARAGTHAPVSACASGAEAVAFGLTLIRAGRADVVLAGGSDACIGPLSIAGFAQMRALSTRNNDPQAASRPFDRRRDGFVVGEGAGIMVLERADHAKARGARPVATLAGAGISSDASHITTPQAEGQVRAIREALRKADITPSDVTHVNAHATGTPTGDVIEAKAIAQAIGQHPVLTAIKSMTGHLLGGSGAVEAIATALAVREGVIPPTRNLADQDSNVKLEVVTGQAHRADIRAAISNSFGFGGHNVVLAFTRAN